MHEPEGQGGYGEGKIPVVEIPREVEMAHYDELPKHMRDVLKDAPIELSARDIREKGLTSVVWIDALVKLARDYYRKVVSEFYF